MTRVWWRRRTLRSRLSLLVTLAVTGAVLLMAVLAWTAVAEIVRRQIRSELVTDAAAIAAQPDQWLTTAQPSRADGDKHGQHELGPRWQIVDSAGTVRGQSTDALPVTSQVRAVAAGSRKEADERVVVRDDSYWMLTLPADGGGAVQVAVNEKAGQNTQQSFGLLLAISCLLGVLVAWLLGRWVARAGLRPVAELTDAVEGVAANGNLPGPIGAEGDDEIARLGRAVNPLLATIASGREAQRALVEDAGHELRTPLTSLRTNIELLLQIEREPQLAHRLSLEDRGRLLSDLDAQARELTLLTTELVDLARDETAREETEVVWLQEVLQTAVARVRTRAPGLTFVVQGENVAVRGRPGELERMIVNVLDNAAKWSPDSGTVRAEIRSRGPKWCQIRVSDHGPGIAEEDRPHVFDRFWRATTSRSMPGSGLGLAIVAQTAGHHGGTASTEANSPAGTIVTIQLPSLP